MRDGDGAMLGAVLVFRDVTERKRAEDLLRRKEAELTDFIENASVGLHWMGPDGTILWANRAELELLGYAKEEYVGRNIVEFHADRPVIDDILCRLVNREELRGYEARLRCKDGSIKHVLINSNGLWEGERFVHTRCFTHDVTDRKRAEEAQARLAAIVESSDDAVISKTLDGIIRSWNAGAERLFGFTAKEAVGQPITLIIPADRQEEERAIPKRQMAKTARNGRAEDKRWHVKKDGSRFFADGVMVSLRDLAGDIRGFGKVIRDATEQKRAADALRDADRRKDEFIALLAYELRNPLASLRNCLQVMRLGAGDANAVNQARTMMERQLGHMVRLIDDLLDISRINQNKMELRRSRVLLADVVSSAVETARPAIESAGHELIVTLPPAPIHLDADLTRLGQVFSNLLNNSAKYTERGGRIWLSAERRDADVVVTVRDTGIGIPADSLPRIFDMFSQVDRSIERSTGGLGIGLALVKGLVGMHDGTVTAASDGQGKGSTFTVKLPALGPLTETLAPVPSDNGQTWLSSMRMS
jgi:PAS domain S-box-containing protein